MYLLHTKKLAIALQENKVHTIDKIMYFLIMVFQYVAGLTAFNFAPALYRFLFTIAKTILEKKADHSDLVVTVYQLPEYHFDSIIIGIAIIGIIGCYWVHAKESNQLFIERFVSLNAPISFRIILTSIIIFCIPLLLLGLYFATQLLALKIPEAPVALTKWQYFVQTIKKANVIKTLWDNVTLFQRAQDIFAQINLVSYVAYFASYVLAILSTIVYFSCMRNCLRFILKK
jgi:hypothetical protein